MTSLAAGMLHHATDDKAIPNAMTKVSSALVINCQPEVQAT
jgi:hypothetical protein